MYGSAGGYLANAPRKSSASSPFQALRTDVGRLNVIGVEQKSDLPLRDRAPLYPAQMEVGSSRNLAAAATA
jgi:hypothetical protein